MSVDARRFAARWSPAVWIITTAVAGLIVGVEVLLVRLAYAASGDKVTETLLIVAMLLLAGIGGIVALLTPWSYTVRSDAIVVDRLGPAVVLRFEQIRAMQRIDSAEIGFAWRTFGSGGFLGSFGWFYSRRVGAFLAYATNRQDLVLVTMNDATKIVLSPHPADAFLAAAQSWKRECEGPPRPTSHKKAIGRAVGG
jgi:hypothetical protein